MARALFVLCVAVLGCQAWRERMNTRSQCQIDEQTSAAEEEQASSSRVKRPKRETVYVLKNVHHPGLVKWNWPFRLNSDEQSVWQSIFLEVKPNFAGPPPGYWIERVPGQAESPHSVGPIMLKHYKDLWDAEGEVLAQGTDEWDLTKKVKEIFQKPEPAQPPIVHAEVADHLNMPQLIADKIDIGTALDQVEKEKHSTKKFEGASPALPGIFIKGDIEEQFTSPSLRADEIAVWEKDFGSIETKDPSTKSPGEYWIEDDGDEFALKEIAPDGQSSTVLAKGKTADALTRKVRYQLYYNDKKCEGLSQKIRGC